MDFNFAEEKKREEPERTSNEDYKKDKDDIEFGEAVRRIKSILSESEGGVNYEDSEKLIQEYAERVLKRRQSVHHPREQNTSDDEGQESDAERIVSGIRTDPADAVDAREPAKKKGKKNESPTPRKSSSSSSSSSSSNSSNNSNTGRGGTAKGAKEKIVFEDSPSEPSTRKGEEELERRFRIDSVKDIHTRWAEDVVRLLQANYPIDQSKPEVPSAQPSTQKKAVKKMPSKKGGSKKKSSPKKKKSKSSGSKKRASPSKLTQSLLKKLLKKGK